jgi:PIN domain nuclease of toxin-antitoxin system
VIKFNNQPKSLSLWMDTGSVFEAALRDLANHFFNSSFCLREMLLSLVSFWELSIKKLRIVQILQKCRS